MPLLPIFYAQHSIHSRWQDLTSATRHSSQASLTRLLVTLIDSAPAQKNDAIATVARAIVLLLLPVLTQQIWPVGTRVGLAQAKLQ